MRIFVASVNEDGRTDEERRYVQLRAKIERLRSPPNLEPWIAEFAHADLNADWRTAVDTCVNALRVCDLLIVVFFRRWGTAIEVDELGPSPVSYLEIELFQASLRQIPVIVFQAEDFRPEPRLSALCRLVRRLIPSAHWVTAPERELAGELLGILSAIARTGELPTRFSSFCDGLSEIRSFRRIGDELDSTRLSFLSGFKPARPGPLSLERVDRLLSEASDMGRDDNATFADRLSRLWIALRELAQQPESRLEAAVVERWRSLCESWTSAAAWLRLHGPLELGVLAALQTQVALRKSGHIGEGDVPFGAFASEVYSIGKASHTVQWQRRRFEAACRLATKEIDRAPQDPSGAHGIRASAALQLAHRGKASLIGHALEDYGLMLATRVRLSRRDAEIGEAQVELAFAEFVTAGEAELVRKEALDRLREGVAMMDGDEPQSRPGFFARGALKLISALEMEGLHDEATTRRAALEGFLERHGIPSQAKWSFEPPRVN